MKRSIMALMAGALVAAVAVSAATLVVGGGVIQAGLDDDLTCVEQVNVLGWGFESDTGLVHFVRVEDPGPACDDAAMFVTVYAEDGSLLASGEIDPLTSSGAPYIVSLDTATSAESIDSINIAIEGGE